MSNERNLLILTRSLTLIILIAFLLVRCAELTWEHPLPGAVLAKNQSPAKSLLAQVIAAEAQGTYTLEVRDLRKGDVIARRTIVVPVGYHAHIASLAWSEDGRNVSATIDHDFGEDNRVFDLRIERPDF